jgi:hypothetical protein
MEIPVPLAKNNIQSSWGEADALQTTVNMGMSEIQGPTVNIERFS